MSTQLWALLSSQVDPNTEIAAIAADPEMKAEARRLCQPLAELAASAGEAAVREALKPLVLVYGVGEAARSPAFWQAYKVLSGLPVDALRRGIEEYLGLADSQFFPKPGPLKALCDKHAEPIYRACYRASKAASLPAPVNRGPPSPEQQAAVQRMAAEVGEILRKPKDQTWPKRRVEPMPSIAGKTDETGITPEMRKAMERRA